MLLLTNCSAGRAAIVQAWKLERDRWKEKKKAAAVVVVVDLFHLCLHRHLDDLHRGPPLKRAKIKCVTMTRFELAPLRTRALIWLRIDCVGKGGQREEGWMR